MKGSQLFSVICQNFMGEADRYYREQAQNRLKKSKSLTQSGFYTHRRGLQREYEIESRISDLETMSTLKKLQTFMEKKKKSDEKLAQKSKMNNWEKKKTHQLASFKYPQFSEMRHVKPA